MRQGVRGICAGFVLLTLAVSLQAATVSTQHAEAFAKKVAQIQQQAAAERRVTQRVPVTEDELNSWFTYRAQPLLPAGVTQPQVTILGAGRLSATAVVDLEEVGRRRSSGGRLDPWNLLGGRVPLTVTGILHTRDGVGRLELQRADISGVPVPVTLVQELVSYYSKSESSPAGLRLDETFQLPSAIREIQVGQGQAVIIQ
jgi:hypothetical protein